MIPLTDLDDKLQDRTEPETLTVKKTTILGVSQTDNTYVIQIDKTVLWIFLFIVNYPVIREVFIWGYELFKHAR